MAQFAALIYSAGRPGPDSPDFGAYMDSYRQFGERSASAIVGGAALLGPETATTLAVRGGAGGEVSPAAGPRDDHRGSLGGFSLWGAGAPDAAPPGARHIPAAFDGGRIEVRPLMLTM